MMDEDEDEESTGPLKSSTAPISEGTMMRHLIISNY
jgi:hypothetical protein